MVGISGEVWQNWSGMILIYAITISPVFGLLLRLERTSIFLLRDNNISVKVLPNYWERKLVIIIISYNFTNSFRKLWMLKFLVISSAQSKIPIFQKEQWQIQWIIILCCLQNLIQIQYFSRLKRLNQSQLYACPYNVDSITDKSFCIMRCVIISYYGSIFRGIYAFQVSLQHGREYS